jgi:hypothetical protein
MYGWINNTKNIIAHTPFKFYSTNWIN